MAGRRIVLGPQRPTPNVPDIIGDLRGEGRVVAISAGWRHDEVEQPKVLEDLGFTVWHLPLYKWYDQIREAELEVHGAHARRQSRVRQAKRLYRIRLNHAVHAYRGVLAKETIDEVLWQDAIQSCMDHLREVDAHFLELVRRIEADFSGDHEPYMRSVAAKGHDNVRRALSDASLVLVAGGHVGVLHTRMRFFGVHELLREAWERGVHVVAWSAGAMTLSDHVVLFDDDTPRGPSHSELFGEGFGLMPGAIFLPHARQRLHLDAPDRVARFAQRYAPAPSIGLEPGAVLELDGDTWRSHGDPDAATLLCADGSVRAFGLGDDDA